MLTIKGTIRLGAIDGADLFLLLTLAECSAIAGVDVDMDDAGDQAAGERDGPPRLRWFDVRAIPNDGNLHRELITTLTARVAPPWRVKGFQTYLRIERERSAVDPPYDVRGLLDRLLSYESIHIRRRP